MTDQTPIIDNPDAVEPARYRLCDSEGAVIVGPGAGEGWTCTGSAHIGSTLVICDNPNHIVMLSTGTVVEVLRCPEEGCDATLFGQVGEHIEHGPGPLHTFIPAAGAESSTIATPSPAEVDYQLLWRNAMDRAADEQKRRRLAEARVASVAEALLVIDEVGYWQIGLEHSLTMLPTGENRAAVAPHWRAQVEQRVAAFREHFRAALYGPALAAAREDAHAEDGA